MATQKQIEANQANARKSTGPKTDTGKAISRMNALTHGMTASVTVLEYEKPQLLEALHNELVRDYKPQTRTEFELVERLTHAFWRARRIPRLEQALFAWLSVQDTVFFTNEPGTGLSYPELDKFRATKPPAEFQELYLGRVLTAALRSDLPSKMVRYEQHLTREIDKTIELLSRLQNERKKHERPSRPKRISRSTDDRKTPTSYASPQAVDVRLDENHIFADVLTGIGADLKRKGNSGGV